MLSRVETLAAFECCSKLPSCDCVNCPMEGPGFGVECRKSLRDSIAYWLKAGKQITTEEAIEHLTRTGWMQRHDREMTFDSLSAVVNNLLRDGNKTISVNIYPWKDDGNETT